MARKAPGPAARDIVSRGVAAALGGYLLASVLPVPLAALWPMPRVDAVLTALALSFIVYTAAVMWAFAARSAKVAWLGLAMALAVSAIAAGVLV